MIFLIVAQQPFLHHVDGTQKTVFVAALLRADEKHLVFVLLAGVADELIFFERERERFLAEDVLAGFECFDGNFDVPVVRRHDADDVDVVAIEHTPVVGAGDGLAVADGFVADRRPGVASVNVAADEDIAEAVVLACIPCPHATQADATDPRPVVRRTVGKCGSAPGEDRRHGRTNRGESGRFEKVATRIGGHGGTFGMK